VASFLSQKASLTTELRRVVRHLRVALVEWTIGVALARRVAEVVIHRVIDAVAHRVIVAEPAVCRVCGVIETINHHSSNSNDSCSNDIYNSSSYNNGSCKNKYNNSLDFRNSCSYSNKHHYRWWNNLHNSCYNNHRC
jgi:hypothetical protein